ncbi:dNTP triphosphohydrolase [Desulfovibrio sp. OttesenSCG-928-G15]|nr:dNTP triphosphohydrolase [Desulfovibrio sp. OttesenSCG-928-G15]
MSQERWKELLFPKRFRESSVKVNTHWNPFDSDYSRISLSAPFRRLQDKAQVFPFDNNDFVRTRLTHSIEVSGIGRSIGVRIEDELIKSDKLNEEKRGHIPSLLAVSGLIHDIGNPPFGHFGEVVIQNFFNGSSYISTLSELQKRDFIFFDGNVQSLRLLLKLGLSEDEYSYNLTFPTLASIIKYPKSSETGNKSKDERKNLGLGVSFKKFGYFQAEKEQFEQINVQLGLKDCRHPLCFILEASDDICYSVSDIEDGVAKNIVSIESVKSLLDDKDDALCRALLDNICKWEVVYKKHPNYKKLLAQKIRVFAQQEMIKSAISSFIDNHDDIISCNFDDELIKQSKSAQLREVFSSIGEICFRNELVIKRELLGNTVLNYLLKEFIECSISQEHKDIKTTKGKLYTLISDRFRYISENSKDDSTYNKLLMVTDFISGMTDSYAVNLYNGLIGIEVSK